MGRMSVNDYIHKVQDVVMKGIDVKRLDGEDVMFRIVDARPLVPRTRVEVGVKFNGENYLASTQYMNDPKDTGKAIAAYINGIMGEVA